MYATYHLSSAQEVNSDILDAIKATFKSKPITIIVREDKNNLAGIYVYLTYELSRLYRN